MRAASSKRSWPIPNSACPRDAERHWPILPVVPTTALPTSRRPSPTSLAYGSTLSCTRQPPLAILTCGPYVSVTFHSISVFHLTNSPASRRSTLCFFSSSLTSLSGHCRAKRRQFTCVSSSTTLPTIAAHLCT